MTLLLDVRDVTKRYGGVVANDAVSLQVREGEIVPTPRISLHEGVAETVRWLRETSPTLYGQPNVVS